MRRILATLASGLVIAVLSGLPLAAQEDSTWDVPEEARAEKNPVEPTPEAIETGKGLYEKHCLMCHGGSGEGDGPATQFIKPAPADISTKEAQDRMTDGEIFYKVTNGKRPMPAMDRKMSAEERWHVVHYVRTLQVN